jgi:hypothetical protein
MTILVETIVESRLFHFCTKAAVIAARAVYLSLLNLRKRAEPLAMERSP